MSNSSCNCNKKELSLEQRIKCGLIDFTAQDQSTAKSSLIYEVKILRSVKQRLPFYQVIFSYETNLPFLLHSLRSIRMLGDLFSSQI
jgi:hypothetical protein